MTFVIQQLMNDKHRVLPFGVLSTRRTADNWAGGEEDGIENPAR